MRKLVGMILTVSMISLCACGSSNGADASSQEPVIVETTAAVTDESVEETTADVTETVTSDMTESNITGIVVDAAMHYVMVQAQDGSYAMFSTDDQTDVNCADGIILGNVVDIVYTGSSENGDGMAVEISDSTVKAGVDRETLQYAASLIQTVQMMDQDTLAAMMCYPAYVCVGDIDETVKDQAAFKALNRETLFSMELVNHISDYNLFQLEESEAGFVLGGEKPNIIFQRNDTMEDGFGITGING